MGGAGGPLAVYAVTIIAAELGKLVSKETRIDILVTPCVTVIAGIAVAQLIAAPIGTAARAVGLAIMWATELQPFFMGVLVSALIGIRRDLRGLRPHRPGRRRRRGGLLCTDGRLRRDEL